jgi:3-deoxy-manno-octulosonate cytidylyltransferase (CMP-KDO synthetase)
MTRALCVIPARFASTRFPGKPLAADTGKPLIQHVVENARRAALVDRVVVATDDPRIFDAVQSFGGDAVMTDANHPNGTSRIAQAVTVLNDQHELIVNVQGDEPEIDPAVIDQLIAGLAGDPGADIATLSADFAPGDDPANPNVVKLVVDRHHRALYFSRSLIPHHRAAGLAHQPSAISHQHYLKHPGLYAYRRDFLLKYPTLAPTPLEQAECLEQLRVLEHGYRIAVIHTTAPHPGIDTPEQYAAFVQRYRATA